jgi:hypothetical protein
LAGLPEGSGLDAAGRGGIDEGEGGFTGILWHGNFPEKMLA